MNVIAAAYFPYYYNYKMDEKNINETFITELSQKPPVSMKFDFTPDK
jgi:hypothetical protein